MSRLVIFENPGEIDPRLISTFGVNVKESDSAIGFFGTGLKYALAILVREGCAVTIWSGLTRYEFGKRVEEIRGKPFEFVTMNGEPMGFTTEVGKKWQLWMAYRELYCNAQDEGGRCDEADTEPDPEAGLTRVIVSGDAFTAVRRDHWRYFIGGEPMIVTPNIEIHDRHGAGVYFRGVLVGTAGAKPTRYTYNLRTAVELTEDRTLKDQWTVSYEIARAVVTSDNRDFIRACVNNGDLYHEGGVDYDWDFKPSAAFMEVMESLVLDRVASANQSAIKAFKKNATTKTAPKTIVLNPVEVKMLEKARAFCARLGFEITYPVSVVESLGTEILGMAADETIYVSHRAFMMGTKTVAGTLIEEFIHLKHGLSDCTRGLQNYLLDRLVSMGELQIGEPL